MAQKGFLCHQNLFAPSVFWEHNSTMFPGNLAVRYRLAGRRFSPGIWVEVTWAVALMCSSVLYLPPTSWLEVPGQPWEPGLKMKKLVASCVLNQELRSTTGTTTWKRNAFVRSLIFRSSLWSNHSDTHSGILASCILPSIYSSNAPPIGAGMNFASTICW